MIDKQNSWSTHIRLKEGQIDGVGFIDLLDGGGLKLSLLVGPRDNSVRGVGFVGSDEVKQLYEVLKRKFEGLQD